MINGITVSPGDYVIGDRDGTLLLSVNIAEAVIMEAEAAMTMDTDMRPLSSLAVASGIPIANMESYRD